MSDWKPSASLLAADRIVAQLEEEAAAAGSIITPVFRHRMVDTIATHLDIFSTRVHDAPAPAEKVWQQVPTPNTADDVNVHANGAQEDARAQAFTYQGTPVLMDRADEGHFIPVPDVEAAMAKAAGKRRGPKPKGKKAGKRGRTAALYA